MRRRWRQTTEAALNQLFSSQKFTLDVNIGFYFLFVLVRVRPKSTPHVSKTMQIQILVIFYLRSAKPLLLLLTKKKKRKHTHNRCVFAVFISTLCETVLIPHLKFNFCFCLYACHFIGAQWACVRVRVLDLNNVFRLLIFVYALTLLLPCRIFAM